MIKLVNRWVPCISLKLLCNFNPFFGGYIDVLIREGKIKLFTIILFSASQMHI
jgi:hypothetical protein